MRIRLITLAAATAAAATATAAVAGCSSASSTSTSTTSSPSASTPSTMGFPVTVTAANGPVKITSKPSRIVSLSATATEDLYAVGAGQQVVAVDETSDYPANAPKTSLNALSPNIEAIAKYNPSLVIAEEDEGGLVSGLTKLGVPVLIEPTATSLGNAYAQIDQIGEATGHAAQAQSVTSKMQAEITADIKKAGAVHDNLSYYWEVSANPYYSATSQTFIGQIVGMFGLKNIADAANKASDGGYPELSEEYIVAAKPQIIFLTDNDPGDGGQSPAVVAKRPGWSAVPAVKDHEVIALNDDIASRWGPRLPQLVAAIAQAVENAPKS
ncbi:MAG TPA: ABC transporter substrate-binding protein [Trebonia sp.]|jgi:iron complex transport system substrate-binding protein|nr:ABC transporter substrate-binding protein [Trebonia sp.]